jgi:hypothetical protein
VKYPAEELVVTELDQLPLVRTAVARGVVAVEGWLCMLFTSGVAFADPCLGNGIFSQRLSHAQRLRRNDFSQSAVEGLAISAAD